jgi:membrane-bound serine protease (ClpP class)
MTIEKNSTRDAEMARKQLAIMLFLLASLLGIARPSLAADQPAPNAPPAVPAADVTYTKPVRIKLEGMITILTHEYMKRQLDRAREESADLVIIEIDSPGGDAQASIDIAETLAEIKWARTVAYVEKQAISGGAFVALGCEEILLSPTARIGDAGPIVMGEDSQFRHAPEKIVSFLAASVRTIAEHRHHPPAIAEAMVDKSLTVFHYRHCESGEAGCFSEAEIIQKKDADRWEKVKPVFGSGNDRFLTLNGKSATEVGLAVGTVSGLGELKERYKLTTEPMLFESTWVDTLVAVLNFPLVAGLLLVLGLIFLYVEFYIPGIGIFGILSALCFGIFFWATFLGGTADWLEVLLFLGGVACILTEFFILPGLGVFGLTGVLLVIAGLTMAITPAASQLTNSLDTLSASATTVGSAMAIFLVAAIVLARFLGTIPLFRRMMLAPPDGSIGDGNEPIDDVANSSWSSLAVGQQGIARTPLRPAGKARFEEMEVDVVAEGSFVAQGSPVRIVIAQGNRIVVRAINGK